MTDMQQQIEQNPQTYKSADDFLQWLQANKDFELNAPVDINKIVELLGLQVVYDYSIDNIIGKIEFSDNGQATITVNLIENSYEPRRRFTLAHEVGHYCLHRSSDRKEFLDNRKTMSRDGSYWDIYESQANQFAAELLMPIDLLLDKGTEVIGEFLDQHHVPDMPRDLFIKDMSAIFQVSNPAMEFRLKNLNII